MTSFSTIRGNELLKGFIANDIEKARSMPEGHISTYGGKKYRKTNGKWVAVNDKQPEAKTQTGVDKNAKETTQQTKNNPHLNEHNGHKIWGTSEEGWFASKDGVNVSPSKYGKTTWATRDELIADLDSVVETSVNDTSRFTPGGMKNLPTEEVEAMTRNIQHYGENIHNAAKAELESRKTPVEQVKNDKIVNTSLILTLPGETKKFKGDLRFDNKTKTYSLVGKLDGGHPYEKTGLTTGEAENYFESRNNQLDINARNINTLGGNKEYATDYKKKFLESQGASMGHWHAKDDNKKLDILTSLLDSGGNNAYRVAVNKGVNWDSVKEETIDSRFSNERPGYIGMASGSLQQIVKQTAIIGGNLYQTVKNVSHDTRGFW